MGALLQVAGALIEGFGLLLIALGIAETRESYPGAGPGTLKKAWRRFLSKLPWYKPPTQTIQLEGIGSSSSVGSIALTRGFKWMGDLEQRVQNLQRIVQEHEDQLGKVEIRIGEERSAVEGLIDALRTEMNDLKQHTERRIAETATSGLDREVYGLIAFAVGLALQTWGGVGF